MKRTFAALAAGLVFTTACDAASILAAGAPTAEWPEFAPVATLPAFGGAWSQGPVGIGQALTVGAVEVQVNGVLRPADTVVTHADSYPVLERGEQFAMVDVSATCRAAPGESCTVTELNFNLSDGSGMSFSPEFAMSVAGLPGLFEGGQIPPGDTLSGDVVFVVDREATALVLTYNSFPGGPGPLGRFTLGP